MLTNTDGDPVQTITKSSRLPNANKCFHSEFRAPATVSSCCVATDPSRAVVLRTHFQPGATIIQVRGAIAACNAAQLGEHVDGLITSAKPLILDLRKVGSFGDDGFRTLVRISERAHRRKARWALVPSDAVDRAIRTTHSDYRLPIAASVVHALQQSCRAGHKG